MAKNKLIILKDSLTFPQLRGVRFQRGQVFLEGEESYDFLMEALSNDTYNRIADGKDDVHAKSAFLIVPENEAVNLDHLEVKRAPSLRQGTQGRDAKVKEALLKMKEEKQKAKAKAEEEAKKAPSKSASTKKADSK